MAADRGRAAGAPGPLRQRARLFDRGAAAVSTCAEVLGVGFEPAPPTPGELEAINLNDERLARGQRAGLGPAVAAVGVPA